MEQPNQEICSIRIMFPVNSDEQAIACKKKVYEALSDISGIKTEFLIMPVPSKIPMGLNSGV